MEEPTLFDAMRSFHDISQAVAFTSNEIALFHALLYTWNVARRPAVIEQWGDTTSRNAGLSKDTLTTARNKLAQKGVIYFEKQSNRSVPRYSLNALFGIQNPLLREIRSKSRSKPPSKCRVSDGVNAASYQGKEKDNGREKEPLRFAEEIPAVSLSNHSQPNLDEVMKMVGSTTYPLTAECAEAYWHDRESVGWMKRNQPIANWRADLSRFASHWMRNEQTFSKSNNQKGERAYVREL